MIDQCYMLHNRALDSIDDLEYSLYKGVRKIYDKRHSLLIEKIKASAFINDYGLEALLNSIKIKLETNNQLTKRERLILIEKNPQINAVCMGNGIFIVNVGLISKIENRDQLAFIIAHEFAHYELEHVKDKVIKYVELNNKTKANLKPTMNKSTLMFNALGSLKNILYATSRLSKEDELQADSLGLLYIKNAGFNANEAISALNILEASEQPKHPLGEKLFTLFDYKEYPFDYEWLRPKLSAYDKKPTSIFIFQIDSLKTHPAFVKRRSELKSKISNLHYNGNLKVSQITNEIIKSEFETVEAARYTKQLDISTYHAMQLFDKYPYIEYSRNRIAKNLFVLYKSKIDGTFDSFVSPFTGYYSEELKYVNTFLYNLSPKELSQVIFYFLKNRRFSLQESNEYYALMYKASNLTGNRIEAKKVYKEYLKYYPNEKSLTRYDLK